MLGFSIMFLAQIGCETKGYPVNLAVVLLFMEASTPFVCLRWFMKEHGLTDSDCLMKLNSVFLYLAFIGCRVGYQTAIWIFSMVPYLLS